MKKYSGILSDGKDFDISSISSCDSTLNECEESCAHYYSCNTVTIANDILRDYELNRPKKLYFDMDGVLATWQEGTPIETVCSPGYFANLPAEQYVVDARQLPPPKGGGLWSRRATIFST